MFIVYNRVGWDLPMIDSAWQTREEASNRQKELDAELEEYGFNSRECGWDIFEIPVGQKNLYIAFD